MTNKVEIITDCILRIAKAEKDYLKKCIDRNMYLEIVIDVKNLYTQLLFDQNFGEDKYYKIFLLLLLEKSYQCLSFENKLLDAVSSNLANFESRLGSLANEISFLYTSDKNEKNYLRINGKSMSGSLSKISKRSNYPQKVLRLFKQWLKDHISNPYPSEYEKQEFCEITGLDMAQINNWFINARRRLVPRSNKKKI
ncbi:hypothetical protein P3W45_001811 [Vairimorpha bombi]|jgi:homeobox protein TGIF1